MIKAQCRTLLICTETLTWRQFYVFLEDFILTIADPINEVNQSINQPIDRSLLIFSNLTNSIEPQVAKANPG